MDYRRVRNGIPWGLAVERARGRLDDELAHQVQIGQARPSAGGEMTCNTGVKTEVELGHPATVNRDLGDIVARNIALI